MLLSKTIRMIRLRNIKLPEHVVRHMVCVCVCLYTDTCVCVHARARVWGVCVCVRACHGASVWALVCVCM